MKAHRAHRRSQQQQQDIKRSLDEMAPAQRKVAQAIMEVGVLMHEKMAAILSDNTVREAGFSPAQFAGLMAAESVSALLAVARDSDPRRWIQNAPSPAHRKAFLLELLNQTLLAIPLCLTANAKALRELIQEDYNFEVLGERD